MLKSQGKAKKNKKDIAKDFEKHKEKCEDMARKLKAKDARLKAARDRKGADLKKEMRKLEREAVATGERHTAVGVMGDKSNEGRDFGDEHSGDEHPGSIGAGSKPGSGGSG